MKRLAIVVALTAPMTAPVPGMAQDTFSLPAGCTGYATVQKRSCVVSHLFTCTGDPDGYQRRVDIDDEGLSYTGMIDAETQWIESEHLRIPASDRLEPGADDPASFSTLIDTGFDSWSFQIRTLPGTLTQFSGHDRLTGETMVLDGVLLERTEFVAVASVPGGEELWRQTGREWIVRDWRTFLSGTRTTILPDETYDTDNSPMSIALPGDAGFLARAPREGCGAMLSLGLPADHFDGALPANPRHAAADTYPTPTAPVVRTALTGDTR